MSVLAELDRSNIVDIDLGSAEFKANAHRHMAEWAQRPPFYVLSKGAPPQVVVGRYADVHRVFSDTETFHSEMPKGPGWEQFHKFMLGLAITFWSWFALLLLAARAVWFHVRVLRDEERLASRFGDGYAAYRRQVKRWLPGIF